MSCPASASLKKLGKLIGHLKHTMGQHSLLELKEPGHGLVHQSFETRWILETFSDSDWSGAKGHRRSTSSAIHMVNGVVVASSSRGQKSASLSSAEAELNALVSSAPRSPALQVPKSPSPALPREAVDRRRRSHRGSGRWHPPSKVLRVPNRRGG